MDVDDVVQQLHDRIERHPPQRYPVQHATAQFHLGHALLQRNQPAAAVDALQRSLEWFPEALEVERAKVLNLLGAALRAAGQFATATERFVQAAELFAEHGLRAEHAAALFNLGLVQRDAGDTHAAIDAFAAARQQFAVGPLPPRSAAALQLGSALLEAGDAETAKQALEEALDLAQRAGETATVGAAANALGLAHLACDNATAAIDAFRLAVSAHPRSLHPAEFAMAKANLALAYEAASQAPHARLAARQAMAVPRPPEPVAAQAAAVLARMGGRDDSDLLAILDQEPRERWHFIVAEELARMAGEPPADRRAEARTWIRGQVARPDATEELAAAWVGALLELPPAQLDAVVAATIQGAADVGGDEAAAFRSRTARAMALFPVPQLLRLRDRFNDLAAELGEPAAWN